MMKNQLKWICVIFGILALVGLLGFALIRHRVLTSLGPPKTVESLEQYERVLRDWKKTGLVDHFPSQVPANAEWVRFASFPGYMQGGGWVQIRMELPGPEVKRLYEHATKTAKRHHDGGHSLSLINGRFDGVASADPHTLGTETFSFPDDYRIFIFYAKPHKKGSGHDWNHGRSKGMVVSLQRNEVLYFAEKW